MTSFTLPGAAIAGGSLRLQSRKPVLITIPKRHPTLGLTYPFNLQQNSEAEINAELNPKICPIDQNAALNLGDMLLATRISGFSTKPLPAFQLIQATGAHKGMEAKCTKFGYAKIDIALRTVLERLAKVRESLVTAPKQGAKKKLKKK